jgi:cytochrome c
MSRSVGSTRIWAISIVAVLGVQFFPTLAPDEASGSLAASSPSAPAGAAVQSGTGSPAEQLIQKSDCSSCHAVDRAVVGPAYVEIAKKYSGQSDVAITLARRIREGSAGNWGDTRMPPHPDLTDDELAQIVRWILTVKAPPAAVSAKATTRRYSYKTEDGKAVSLDFPLFVEGSSSKVTKDVFRGYALFNSYCFRCHGTDATESQLGPNLRRTVEQMTARQFLAVAMPGREDKGMPSWAGFISEEEMTSIYRYVKGRSVGLLSVGRPASEFE